MQKLLRALHKDRAHALAHYRHLLSVGGATGLEAAATERPRTLERLVDIDRAVNQSMAMLQRYPELSNKLTQLMEDYIQALRSKDDTPGSMLGMTEEAEAEILDKYRDEIERKVTEKDRQRIVEKQRKEQRMQEREKLREDKLRAEAKKLEEMVKEEKEEKEKEVTAETTKDTVIDEVSVQTVPTVAPTVDDSAVQQAVEDVAAAVAHQEIEPRMQHIMAHDLGHGEAVSIRSFYSFALVSRPQLTIHFGYFAYFCRVSLFAVKCTVHRATMVAVFTSHWHLLALPSWPP